MPVSKGGYPGRSGNVARSVASERGLTNPGPALAGQAVENSSRFAFGRIVSRSIRYTKRPPCARRDEPSRHRGKEGTPISSRSLGTGATTSGKGHCPIGIVDQEPRRRESCPRDRLSIWGGRCALTIANSRVRRRLFGGFYRSPSQ